jgi:hypothetical protein
MLKYYNRATLNVAPNNRLKLTGTLPRKSRHSR